MSVSGTVAERFWRRVDRSGGPDACWPWLGWRGRGGYGRVKVQYRHRLAHRLAFELVRGAIPAGQQLDHLCRNRACVNPAHLEPVTAAENIRRGLTGNAQRAKTHCAQGHPYDVENTYWFRGGRQCRACNREKSRARTRALRAA